MHFIYDEAENLTVREYFEVNKDNLPDLIMVTGGHYGVTKYEDYANDQVIRFHTYSSQKRVLARESIDAKKCNFEYLSIPVNDGRNRFRIVHGLNNVGPLDTMANILLTCKVPVLVRFADRHPEILTVHGYINHEVKSDFLLTKIYEENYLLGNCLLEGVIQPQITTAALSDNIQITSIKGIEGKSEEEFKVFLAEMDSFVQNMVKFDRRVGNPAITKIQFNSLETGTGASIDKNNPLIPLDEAIPSLEKATPPVPRRNISRGSVHDSYVKYYPLLRHPPSPPTSYSILHERNVPPRLPPRPNDLDRQHSINSSDGSNTYTMTSRQSQIEDLSIKDVGKILKKLNLDRYSKQFEKDFIDGTLLKELNQEILEENYKFRKQEAKRLTKYLETGNI